MTAVQRFRRTELVTQPWKNGGGTTREIVSWPPGTADRPFDWRISIAHIAHSGPFSVFAGVDRVITLLEGSGVVLTSMDGAWSHRLDQRLTPFAFAGDEHVQADLMGSDCHDLNVMTRRAACSSGVQVLRSEARWPAASGGALMACHGPWWVNGLRLDADEGLWWHDGTSDWEMRPLNDDAALVAVRIELPR